MTNRVKKKIQLDGPSHYRIIDTRSDLEKVSTGLLCKKRIGVDLEADSMHHYREKVCLLQIAADQQCLVIDPLKIGDLSPLKPVFSNPGVQKVFHGSDYDVRSLYRDFQIEIRNLFDTELACRFLGCRESGLESVLYLRFQVQLNKKFQRNDWSVRPLPESMIAYAASDVYYLIPLAEMLQKELREKSRSDWVDEECLHLSRVRPPSPNHEPLYVKFKGAGRLAPRNLAVLDALLVLRDEIAAKKDRPHYKIIGNEPLKKIALLQCSDVKQLEKARILSRKQIGMYGDDIRTAVCKALSVSEDRLPVYPHKPSVFPAGGVRKRMKAIRTWRDHRAEALGLDPAILLSKAQMAAIVRIHPRSPGDLDRIPEIKNWQRKAFGADILEAFQQGIED